MVCLLSNEKALKDIKKDGNIEPINNNNNSDEDLASLLNKEFIRLASEMKKNREKHRDYILIIGKDRIIHEDRIDLSNYPKLSNHSKDTTKDTTKDTRNTFNHSNYPFLSVNVCFDILEKPYVSYILNKKDIAPENIKQGIYYLTLAWWDW